MDELLKQGTGKYYEESKDGGRVAKSDKQWWAGDPYKQQGRPTVAPQQHYPGTWECRNITRSLLPEVMSSGC